MGRARRVRRLVRRVAHFDEDVVVGRFVRDDREIGVQPRVGPVRDDRRGAQARGGRVNHDARRVERLVARGVQGDVVEVEGDRHVASVGIGHIDADLHGRAGIRGSVRVVRPAGFPDRLRGVGTDRAVREGRRGSRLEGPRLVGRFGGARAGTQEAGAQACEKEGSDQYLQNGTTARSVRVQPDLLPRAHPNS